MQDTSLIDPSLLITIGLIFLVTLIGAYIRSTRKDRCLKSWEGFHITLEKTNNKLIWGVLKVQPTGMELSYLDSVQDDKHLESSYLLYGSEYGEIQAIYRYADRLSEWGKKERERNIQHSFHPNLLHRFGRETRNFLSTATDSLNEVFGILVGRVQKTGARYLADGGASIKTLVGGKVLGQVGTVYDPLLEYYIGHRVVIELLEGDEVHEHVGIFKEYSGDFIEILDVQYPYPQVVSVAASQSFESDRVIVMTQGQTVRLLNRDERPVLLASMQVGEREQMINAVVDSGETIELNVGDTPYDQIKLRVQVVRELDMILPRTRCLVRHRAENVEKEDLPRAVLDFVFDVGRLIDSSKRPDNREALLRQEVRTNPNDAVAAANLGLLLIQKDDLTEAEKWLRQALRAEYSLPDSGRRVRMQLREIERRRLPYGEPVSAAARPADTPPSNGDHGSGI
jgi:hypothetical protein